MDVNYVAKEQLKVRLPQLLSRGCTAGKKQALELGILSHLGSDTPCQAILLPTWMPSSPTRALTLLWASVPSCPSLTRIPLPHLMALGRSCSGREEKKMTTMFCLILSFPLLFKVFFFFASEID